MAMFNHTIRTSAALIFVVALTACAGQQTVTKSSVVDYLYPKDAGIVVEPQVPVLNIPIKVGIAFVPEQSSGTRGMNLWAAGIGGSSLSEASKQTLLEQVAKNFRQYDFVSEIEVIPSAYLTAGGSFKNLDQIRSMYGVDIMALVSYDQVQFTDEGLLSLSYWTIVGAYVVSGEKNDTNTMVDTAVYDIQSRQLLFRAPGTSAVKSSATPINLSEALREDSLRSFELATAGMITNLDNQLSSFRTRIKDNPEKVQVVRREGYTGSGGAMGLLELMFLMSMAALARRRRC